MNILVTGANGLIGRYIYQKIIETGLYSVTAANRDLIPDLADSSAVNILKKMKPWDVIVHCAAKIPTTNTSMSDIVETNRKIDRNIFQYCNKTHTNIIFMSGMSVYAQYGQDVVIDEKCQLLATTGDDNYFREKVNSELLFMQLADTVIFRISSPYGKSQKNRTVLKIFTENVKQNKDICYYDSGQRTQDFVHGSDIADAVLCALRQNEKGIFNIVSGESISMERLAFLIASLSQNYTGKIYSNNITDPQDNFRANFSNTKAKKILGWNPVISLSTGISELL